MELTKGFVDFIDDAKIHSLINNTREDPVVYRAILKKSLSKQPLTVEETAALIAVQSPDGLHEIFETARELKRSVYGNRIVLFAPLYIGNYCINDCQYCGFRRSLRSTVRHSLSDEELVREVRSLEDEGHKRLILVYGEHPKYTPEFIAHTVKMTYATKSGKGEIRRVNINAAPLDIEGYKTVKAAGIGTFQVFQETYHKETYARYHPGNTQKSNYLWRLNAMDRAFEGGIDDMGIGALFGLYDWRFEVLGLVSHAIHLQTTYGVGPHTISFPRIQPANGMELDLPYRVSDQDFKKLVAILRLAVPYTGLIMTARESRAIRDEVIRFLERLPQLTGLLFNDHTPFISEQTKQWLAASPDAKVAPVAQIGEESKAARACFAEQGLEAALRYLDMLPEGDPAISFTASTLPHS